jgi:hypothetical protein
MRSEVPMTKVVNFLVVKVYIATNLLHRPRRTRQSSKFLNAAPSLTFRRLENGNWRVPVNCDRRNLGPSLTILLFIVKQLLFRRISRPYTVVGMEDVPSLPSHPFWQSLSIASGWS